MESLDHLGLLEVLGDLVEEGIAAVREDYRLLAAMMLVLWVSFTWFLTRPSKIVGHFDLLGFSNSFGGHRQHTVCYHDDTDSAVDR